VVAERFLRPVLRAALLLAAATAVGLCLAQGNASRPGASMAAAGAPSQTTQWVPVRGQAFDLAINPKGDVYAIDATGTLWRLPAEEAKVGGSAWGRQPGQQYRRVRATHDGAMWAVDPVGNLYRREGSVWRWLTEGVRDVAAAPDGQVYILTIDGRIVDFITRTPIEPAFPVTSSPVEALVLDAHGLPWLQRQDRSVIRFDGTAWQNVAGAGDQLAMVTAGYDGTILAIAVDGRIMRYDAARNTWQDYVAEGRAIPPMRHIAISPIGLPWGISRAGELLAERPIGVPPPPAESPSVFTRLLSWVPTGKKAAQVSVAHDGNVIALAPDGSLWRRKRGNEWTQVRVTETKFRAIAAGTAERGWGLSDKGDIVQFGGGFEAPPVALPQIRLMVPGPKGTLWAVAGADDLQQWNPVRRAWERVMKLPERPISIAIGSRGEPWLIDEKGVVRTQRQNGDWNSISGIKTTSVGAGPDGTVYATSAEMGIYWLDVREMRWKPASGKASRIAVGPGGAALAINPDAEMLISGRFPDAATPQQATQTATTSRASTTTTASSDTTATDSSLTSPSAFVVVPPGATGPTPGVRGATTPGGFVSPAIVVGSTAGFTVSMPRTTSTKPLSFETIVGTARFNDIGIGASGAVFATSTDGGLMCFNNAAKSFILASSGINSRVAVAPDGTPSVLNTNGKVSRFDKLAKQWRIVPNFTGVDISYGPDGQLWAAANTGSVFRYNTASDSFDLEPVITSDVSFRARRVAGASPVSGGRAYWVVTEQSQLVRCEKGDCRVRLTGATDAAVAPDNTLFALDLLGNLQRYDAVKKIFEKQNGTGSAIAVGPGGFPWLVNQVAKIDSSGIYAANSKTINTADCALAFATAPPPLPPPPTVVLVANADSGTLAPGATLDLLANDTFAGRAANISDVTVSLDTTSPYLALSGGSAVVALNAAAGVVLNGTYKICPRNVSGNCVTSTIAITVSGTTTAPTAVSGVGGNAQATISFTAPGVGGVSSYTVVSNPGSVVANGTSSPITILGLTNGVQYTFTVTAKFTNGTSKTSDSSNPVTPSATITEPTAPTIGTATAGNTQATLSFTAPASNGGATITGYTVTSLPGGITATGTGSPITVTGLTNGTAYTFTVRAQNSIGLGAPSAASNSVTPPGAVATVPGASTGATALAGVGPGVVQVSFTAPASNGGSAITSYTVTSSPGGLTGVGASSPIAITGLTGGTLYTFTVTATNVVGTGAASTASAGVTAVDVPGAPTALTDATVPASGTITLTFAAPASTGGAAISVYDVMCVDQFFAPLPPFQTAGSPANLGGPEGVTTGFNYQCQVAAENTAFPGMPGAPAGPVPSNP
jgi:hypothetical protein